MFKNRSSICTKDVSPVEGGVVPTNPIEDDGAVDHPYEPYDDLFELCKEGKDVSGSDSDVDEGRNVAGDDITGTELSCGESDDSVEGDDDSVEEDDVAATELLYDDEEMLEIRRANKKMRQEEVQKGCIENLRADEGATNMGMSSVGDTYQGRAVGGQNEGQNAGNIVAATIGSASHHPNWIPAFTTYEGGYESDPRESDDEGPAINLNK